MSIAGFILARSGSKRLPNKNIKDLCGKPLICWTIDSAIESGIIDTLIVGTDDDNIYNLCIEKYKFINNEWQMTGLEKDQVILLPGYLVTDNAPQTESLLYCMYEIEKHDYIMLLQPTSPLRIKNDFEILTRKTITGHNIPNLAWNYTHSRNQVTNKVNGAFYMAKWDDFYRDRKFNEIEEFAYYMPEERSVDINTEFDFKIAEFLMQERLKNKDFS